MPFFEKRKNKTNQRRNFFFYVLYRQITFGSNYDAGNFGQTTKIDNLVVHDLNHVERVSGCYGVYEYVAVDSDGILRVQGRVLVLYTIAHINQIRKIFCAKQQNIPVQQCL